MVEQAYTLDTVFGSLSDSTRRDILRRVSEKSMSVSTIASYYDVSLAAVAKHLTILQRAGLIFKTRRGKEQIVTIEPSALRMANAYLEQYQKLWEERLDSLDAYLQMTNDKNKE